jgi:hypothetical protein
MPGPYSGITLTPPKTSPVKRRYSVTQDIVGYRRCPRQYGEINVHKYAPAHQTQLYFGTVLHQVLDRCHGHYHGTVDPGTAGILPDAGAVLTDAAITAHLRAYDSAVSAGDVPPASPSDIMRYFLEVENSLKSRGIRAITRDQRVKAIRILQYFNALEGKDLYPRVEDTEHRLQTDQSTFIMHGVVDLLVNTPGGDRDLGDCEIWDYKGTSRLSMTPKDLESYQFQMQVYAKLYELKHNVLPRRVVIYLLSELDGPTCPTKRPVNATLEFDVSSGLSKAAIDLAMREFVSTVGEIEKARELDQWLPAKPGDISDQDCAICDFRWDCGTPNDGKGVKLRCP